MQQMLLRNSVQVCHHKHKSTDPRTQSGQSLALTLKITVNRLNPLFALDPMSQPPRSSALGMGVPLPDLVAMRRAKKNLPFNETQLAASPVIAHVSSRSLVRICRILSRTLERLIVNTL